MKADSIGTPGGTLKGYFNGPCNVSRCLAPWATWFNQSTRAYYCAMCAAQINRLNRVECKALFGNDDLCIKVSESRNSGPGVIRYVVTRVGKDGMRTLACPAQGRWTYEFPHEAREWIEAVSKNNSEETKRLCGFPLEIRPVECWPVHFDPKGIYFD